MKTPIGYWSRKTRDAEEAPVGLVLSLAPIPVAEAVQKDGRSAETSPAAAASFNARAEPVGSPEAIAGGATAGAL